MDESWRMRMGMPSLTSRRRASEDLTSWTSVESGQSNGMFGGSESGAMEADDFKDVFGGPPRSVLNRKLSCDFTSYDYFYNEIFRRPETEAERSRRNGRKLTEFRIPVASRTIVEKARFYNDMVGSPSNCKGADDDNDEHRMKKSSSSSKLWRSMSMSKWNLKSKSKSKSNSSSVLSYEEISPTIRSRIGEDDVALTTIAAKLRPINVPCRWNSTTAMEGKHQNQSSETPFQYPQTSYAIDNYYPTKEYSDEHLMGSSNPSYSQSQQFPSPDTHIIPYSTTVGIPVDDDELESPSSANSRFYCDQEASNKGKYQYSASYEQRGEAEEDEYLSSYVIEVHSREREAINEAADIDEAIAWAKEKYQGCSSSSSNL
ncbi:hypothetical protein V2J09_018646 [Rumex salicifolius]